MTTSTTFVDLRINNCELFKKSLGLEDTSTKLYLTFGKVDEWASNTSPNTSNASVATIYEIWDNMIGGKELFGSDVSHVIPKYVWTSGETYIAYDHRNPTLLDGNTKFYAVTDDYSVYKCIANNNGSQSTVKPTSLSTTTVQQTGDGYYWKFMYKISDCDQLRFTTTNYMPVKTLTEDDGSLQWQVQESAAEGAINSVLVTNAGSGYANVDSLSVVMTGDGSSFTGYATINTVTNTISSIVVTNPGSGYTYANVQIVDANTIPGTGATTLSIISPPGGHGSSPLYELGGKDLIIDGQLKGTEENTLPATNDYRQICLLKNPINADTNDIMNDLTFVQAYELVVVGSGNYTQDELVYEGATLDSAVYVGRVVSWDPATNKILLINNKGIPLAARTLIGSSSFTARVVSSVKLGALNKLSGRILYIDNIVRVTRSPSQVDDFKIIVKF